MWRRKSPNLETPRCSFCRKSQDVVQKLIASPSADVRVFICDECVSVCQAILEDDRAAKEADTSTPERNELHPFIDDQFLSKLLEAVERWIAKESLGSDAAQELAEMRSIAIRLIGHVDRT
jgi:hypothetical protein